MVLINFQPIQIDNCCLFELLLSFRTEIQSVERSLIGSLECCVPCQMAEITNDGHAQI